MHLRQTLVVAVFAAAIAGLMVPALAQDQDGAGHSPDHGMDTGRTDHGMMGRGMTHGGTMRGGMMSGGWGGMMQSMNGGDGRPNSQWQSHPPGSATPD